MRATIKEVARKARVSIATVSRVLNDSAVVQDETRRIVEEAARALKYSPNVHAKGLSGSKTETLGMLLPELHGEFFSEVIRGSDVTARQEGYHLIVSSSHNDKSEIEAAMRAMHGRVDGLIIMSPLIDAEALNANLPSSLPLVLLNSAVHDGAIDTFNVDNFRGAYDMVHHLIGHGHTRIALIKGSPGNIDAEERWRGYRAALKDAGIPFDPDLEVQGSFNEESAYKAAEQLLGLPARPGAIFASNDSMAIGALSALRSSGVKVPGEIAVAGFDDIPIAKFIKPSLSSVRVNMSEMGLRAVRTLLDAIKKESRHVRQQTLLPVSIALRESCGCGPEGSFRETRF